MIVEAESGVLVAEVRDDLTSKFCIEQVQGAVFVAGKSSEVRGKGIVGHVQFIGGVGASGLDL